MKNTWRCLVALTVCAAPAWARMELSADDPVPPRQADGPRAAEDVPAPKVAPSKVIAVTVYRDTALVTREVAVPEGKGVVEVVASPLPEATLDSSLYTEGADRLRVLSTRYRTRAVKEDARQTVRAKEQEIRALEAEIQKIERESLVITKDLEFLQKLENFTGATMQGMVEKGMLDSQATIGLSKYVMDTRLTKSTESVSLEQKLKAKKESLEFAQRQLNDFSASSSRTEIDAVIVLDKADAAAGTVRLSYLVGECTWQPQYRLRARGEKDPVQLEYLAAIEQSSGEAWQDAKITLSTARPSLDAAIPDLTPLNIAVLRRNPAGMMAGGRPAGPGMAGMGGGMGGMGGAMPKEGKAEAAAASESVLSIEQSRAQAREYRGIAQQQMIGNNAKVGGAYLNEAAALDQAEELLAKDEDDPAKKAVAPAGDEPSVTYHLNGRLTVPSRDEPMLVEVARVEMQPDFFDKAVPVLSPRVYRLARLTNTGDSVLLTGEATMYRGTDFVGRMILPQVAVGEQFTAGFGVDPQVQIGRRLIKKTAGVQGGNQVHNYEFQISVRNYGASPVTLQVWDRLPRAGSEVIDVELTETKPAISDDGYYKRVQRADNLLRWDLVALPGTTGEKAQIISYQFKLAYDRQVSITYQKSGGLMEAPIGGMGGMGGGFRTIPANGGGSAAKR